MATLDDNSIDAIVCDPPYELGFMGKAWDNTGIAYDVTVWQQCFRVLKPGGHLIAFGGSRTYHRLAVAIEDAGFEIRDQIQWIYGSGFPKSLDVSKAMDKQAEATREVIGWNENLTGRTRPKGNIVRITDKNNGNITAPSTDIAKQWQGWGTALKPAHEPAVLARKPLCGTVADNVMTWGVGGLNIDGTRVGTSKEVPHSGAKIQLGHGLTRKNPDGLGTGFDANIGRWPANVILDEDAAKVLDKQSGYMKSGTLAPHHKLRASKNIAMSGDNQERNPRQSFGGDSGGASRFFYTAKASKAEREAGLYYEEWQPAGGMQGRQDGTLQGDPVQRANYHPTVKPLSLMRYLVRLVTPKGGKVLDPFMGSGSTGCASILEGFDFVGIDITPEYIAIAQKRIDYYAVTSPLMNL
jgi:site-specific DNA-methyltransferase (adenine-specific)